MKPSAVIAQCYANVHAVLQYYGIQEPPCNDKLTDRVLFGLSSQLLDQMEWLTQHKKFERWDFVRNHGVTAQSGWREREARCAMQLVRHIRSVEIDFDLWNPNMGAFPAFMHGMECLVPGKTDPYRIAKGLRKRGIIVPEIT